ncbi:pirin family protein [Mucilaginibacter xinganensis]|uniref:Quercetin 2,3-dioxygenase n=1 Tax=Mucilaginibacter xinganensis TaxID=1234841 RepID=A0A223P2L2_9SPHI|nr:pirin family protein [Mucilaginibacter xinganensis]ASU36389.1 Quercetin 2,3-dioxygenase [Mucilaginibacter xinganensis]
MQKLIEKIYSRPARPGMVGDGFRVFNYFPNAELTQKRVSPFLMLDFNAAYDFGPSDHIRGVDVHPHKGFETVTIAYKGSVAHHDSTGNSGVINPGDVQWMTAGAGILHKEYHEESFSKKGGPFEMVQLWVNLPAKDKLTAPAYQPITADQMGKVVLPGDGGVVNIIAGNFNGFQGPATTFTPVNLFDIRLNKGGNLTADIPVSHNTILLVIEGMVTANGEQAAEHDFILFKNEGEEINITADEDSIILLLSGEPINEPIAQYGPFVMNTQQELQVAFQEFQSGKFGVLE